MTTTLLKSIQKARTPFETTVADADALSKFSELSRDQTFKGDRAKSAARLKHLHVCRVRSAIPRGRAARRWLARLRFTALRNPRLLAELGDVPFVHLLAPIAENCLLELLRRLRGNARRSAGRQYPWEGEPPIGLVRGLVHTLRDLSWRCFLEEFEAFRRQTGDASAYERFVRAQRESKDGGVVGKYPVLARILATACAQWIDHCHQLAARLRRDFTSPAARIDMGLSDRHHGGKSVAVVTLTNGERWVYKSRDLACEARFAELQTELNELLPHRPFLAHEIIERDGYGWAKFVEHRYCPPDRIDVFYHNAGSLLGLLHLLGTTDCHLENVRACGCHLVFIDAESLFSAAVKRDGAPADAAFDAEDTAIRTGMLPRWIFQGRAGETLATDFSALGALQGFPKLVKGPLWSGVNTDAMCVTLAFPASGAGEHLPGPTPRAFEFREEICAGYTEMLDLFARHRNVLVGTSGSIFERLAACAVRYIHRPTLAYRLIFENSLRPKYLKDGAVWAASLDLLSHAYLKDNGTADAWGLHREELAAMLRLDIPYFGLQADCPVLCDGRGEPLLRFARSAYVDATRRIASLDLGTVRLQAGIVRQALIASKPASPVGAAVRPFTGCQAADTCGADQCIEAALIVGNRLLTSPLIDQSIWLGLSYHHEGRRFQLGDIGPWFYGGTAGIAVFFAALARVGNEDRFRRAAGQVLDTTLGRLERAGYCLDARTGPCGALEGPPSILFALSLLDRLDPVGGYGERRAALLARMEPAHFIAERPPLDLVAGLAGAALVVGSLRREGVVGRDVFEVVHGRLAALAHGASVETGQRAGLSHGFSSGIFALAKALQSSPPDGVLAAVGQLIDAENVFFDPTQDAWPDMRSRPWRFTSTWCNGALGVRYAREAAAPYVPRAAADLDLAESALRRAGLPTEPTLCCGVAGHMISGDGIACFDEALRLRAAGIIDVLRAGDGLRLIPNVADDVQIPGLFLGESGVGYALLRAARPELVPNFLRFE